jgi:hypothetical protein
MSPGHCFVSVSLPLKKSLSSLFFRRQMVSLGIPGQSSVK